MTALMNEPPTTADASSWPAFSISSLRASPRPVAHPPSGRRASNAATARGLPPRSSGAPHLVWSSSSPSGNRRWQRTARNREPRSRPPRQHVQVAPRQRRRCREDRPRRSAPYRHVRSACREGSPRARSRCGADAGDLDTRVDQAKENRITWTGIFHQCSNALRVSGESDSMKRPSSRGRAVRAATIGTSASAGGGRPK